MMQKVLRVGSSVGVTIPKKSLGALGLKVGDRVDVEVDERSGVVAIRPSRRIPRADTRIAQLTLRFIERYRSDFEALANK